MLKVHPLIMRCNTLDPSCAPFRRAAADAAMPVVYHTGGGDRGWKTETTRPAACAALARAFRRLPLLMAHCGVFGGVDDFAEAITACRKCPNLFLDSTFALLGVGLDRWKDAVARLGPHPLRE
jgi:predicted TIM-barrel fold metal-dependent hydrolase